jgi:hypothetical protein
MCQLYSIRAALRNDTASKDREMNGSPKTLKYTVNIYGIKGHEALTSDESVLKKCLESYGT